MRELVHGSDQNEDRGGCQEEGDGGIEEDLEADEAAQEPRRLSARRLLARGAAQGSKACRLILAWRCGRNGCECEPWA